MSRNQLCALEVAEPVLEPVLGQNIQSPKYGKGFISEIEPTSITVRFWNHSSKTFYTPDGDYPFELIDGVRQVKKQTLVEKIIARETPLERERRLLSCAHREVRALCCKCQGLTATEMGKWAVYLGKERHIGRRGRSNRAYADVKISKKDCVLVSSPLARFNSDREPTSKQLEGYADAPPKRRIPTSDEGIIARDLFLNPNSTFQAGGVGVFRSPLDAPRSTRTCAPDWISRRGIFLRTLAKGRSERGERILGGFYGDCKTDEQIAATEGWGKDSIKKERKCLLRAGDRYFSAPAAKHPPSAAIRGRDKMAGGCLAAAANFTPREGASVLPTDYVGVCSPSGEEIYLYPVFVIDGDRCAKIGPQYSLLASVDGFLREERLVPLARLRHEFEAAAD
jgi:hypothetical protein